MTIPEIRERLGELADRLQLQYGLVEFARELRYYAEETKRRPYIRNTRKGPKRTITPEVRRHVKMLHKQKLAHDDIVRICNLPNVGRVTDILRGRRT